MHDTVPFEALDAYVQEIFSAMPAEVFESDHDRMNLSPGETAVSVRVNRIGNASDLKVIKHSGNLIADDKALKIVQSISFSGQPWPGTGSNEYADFKFTFSQSNIDSIEIQETALDPNVSSAFAIFPAPRAYSCRQ